MGLAVAAPGAYALNRAWPAFRGLTPAIKVFFVTSVSLATAVIRADKAGIQYDQAHYTDRGAAVQRQYHSLQEREWAELSTTDKALTWAKENKFGVVAGTWAASMGGIFAVIHSQPLSFAQKLVQTRVWAQGVTLASLLAMAAITQIPSQGDKIIEQQKHANEHSWRDFVPAQQTKASVSSPSSNTSTTPPKTPLTPPGTQS